jgi:hypothetical protein
MLGKHHVHLELSKVKVAILSDSTSSICKTSLLTCIHHRKLTFGIVRRLSLESQTDNALWAFCGKSKRKYTLALRFMMLCYSFGLKTFKSVQTKEMSSKRELILGGGKHM